MVNAAINYSKILEREESIEGNEKRRKKLFFIKWKKAELKKINLFSKGNIFLPIVIG